MTGDTNNIGAVVIGRNEGERLVRCLTALQGQVRQIVYVDSGSTDDSVSAAKRAGAEVVFLDTTTAFTAARARNAGLDRLVSGGDGPQYVQFLDGDCELRNGWTRASLNFLDTHADVAAVCGRRRERFPENSVYNHLIDEEWDTPIGETKSCGGDALMRTEALALVGGFNPNMIAGEEPELCVRLRQQGWKIWRLDVEMTWHDADITRFGQWWKRNRRAGHAYAEGAHLHGAPPERHNIAQRKRALIWGLALPLIALVGGAIYPPLVLVLLLWPLQVARLARREAGWKRAFFLTLGKIPEAIGILDFQRHRLSGSRSKLIEYK